MIWRLLRVVGVIILVANALAFQLGTSASPDLKQVEKLQFSRCECTAELPAHANVREGAAIVASINFGMERLSSYREPVLTRGTRGVALFRTASPAVVLVTVGRVDSRGDYQPDGLGSGAIVDSRGYILTNWHVIEGYRSAGIITKPTVRDDPRSSEVYVAAVIAQDMTRDLALLKIQSATRVFPVIPLGDLSEAEVAEDIHIIGHPKGELWSYTTGVISQVRSAYEWTYSDNSRHVARVLQLQTAINPGNSGGPVLNDAGRLIGLIAMSAEGQNLDYAVAIDEIRGFLALNLPARTRGKVARSAFPELAPPSLTISQAVFQDGRIVSRSVDRGITAYIISDKARRPLSAIVMVGNHTVRSENQITDYLLEANPSLRGRANASGRLETVVR